jgi:hypothetical protein
MISSPGNKNCSDNQYCDNRMEFISKIRLDRGDKFGPASASAFGVQI